jgi:Flp pilus assembly secretin CpaC
MDIHPKDSSAVLNAQNVPDETSAELVTNILVKDGQTIVIGGLFRDKITAKRTQVPVLGDIPLIGLLFRGKADMVERHEVVVLLTPTVIEEPSETDGDARADDVRRKRFGAKDALQLSGRGRRSEDYYAEAVKSYAVGDDGAATEAVDMSLRLRPGYIEALRLKERILKRTDPDAAKNIERIMLENIDRQEAPLWLRR